MTVLRMPVVWTDRHRGHAPEGGYWMGVRLAGDEEPERGDVLRDQLLGAGATIVSAPDLGPDPVLAVHDAVHLGIATSTEAGLLVPVLRNAQDRDLWGCAAETARLAAGARAGKLTRDELAGSTITLSSLGKLGGIAATPVINHPEVAIVGVNRIVERPVIRAGAVVARPIMNLSSSFDHRIVDGALAAAFVQALREYLEHPALLFVE